MDLIAPQACDILSFNISTFENLWKLSWASHSNFSRIRPLSIWLSTELSQLIAVQCAILSYTIMSCSNFCQLSLCLSLKVLRTLGNCVNSLWPSACSDAIRRQETESTLAQVMACCLTAPSHYLNQCWLIISKVLWQSSKGIMVRRSEDTCTNQ